MNVPTATPPLPADAAALATMFCFHDLFGEAANYEKLPYTYAVTMQVPPRGHGVSSIKIFADSVFYACMTMAVGYNNDKCMVLYRNNNTDRQQSNQPVPVQMIGSITHPMLLPVPLRLMANTSVSVDVRNEADEAASITFALVGFKAFPRRPPVAVDDAIAARPYMAHRGLERLKAFLDVMAEEM